MNKALLISLLAIAMPLHSAKADSLKVDKVEAFVLSRITGTPLCFDLVFPSTDTSQCKITESALPFDDILVVVHFSTTKPTYTSDKAAIEVIDDHGKVIFSEIIRPDFINDNEVASDLLLRNAYCRPVTIKIRVNSQQWTARIPYNCEE